MCGARGLACCRDRVTGAQVRLAEMEQQARKASFWVSEQRKGKEPRACGGKVTLQGKPQGLF